MNSALWLVVALAIVLALEVILRLVFSALRDMRSHGRKPDDE